MSRRPHKKSRTGCADCKRRHIRCDENRPSCANCARAELRCSFLNPDEAAIVPVTFDGPGLSPRDALPKKRSSSNLVSTPGSQGASSWTAESTHEHDEFTVNMTHMQLLHNMASQSYLSVEVVGRGDIPSSLYYKHALKTPYIMHQCLASSALHLATEFPEMSRFWRDYSAGLQHKALTLFNKVHPILQVTADNCEDMFLWSSLVGVHALGEAFVFQRDSISAFMDNFTEGMKLYRGILTVIDQCRDLLFATETGSYLKHSGSILRATTSRDGPECEPLKHMLEHTIIVRDAQQVCLAATLELQHIFNVQKAEPGSQIVVPVILAWPVLITAEYVQLLRDLHPQALIIFAQYAVLLHRARNLWIIGGGGEYLIRGIYELVGPEWHRYLESPMLALEGDAPSQPQEIAMGES